MNINHLNKTAQIFILGGNCDTHIHILDIPHYYGLSKKNKGNNLKWKIYIYDDKGNFIFLYKYILKSTFSKTISLRKILLKNNIGIPSHGQFVISHSDEIDFYCNFYTSYIQNGPNVNEKIFKLHSHRKFRPPLITTRPRKFKEFIKLILYFLGFYRKNIRSSAALTSWGIHEFSNKYIYLIAANHGNEKLGSTIGVEYFLNNGRVINKKLRFRTVALGTKLVDITKLINNKFNLNKFQLNIETHGTITNKPIILILNNKINFDNPKLIFNIFHLQHS